MWTCCWHILNGGTNNRQFIKKNPVKHENSWSHKISIFYTSSPYTRYILAEKISKLKTHNKELNIKPINFYPLN